ncbi:MAG: preprotein translocase subunit YajC [candidate division WOR-3 bacterium]
MIIIYFLIFFSGLYAQGQPSGPNPLGSLLPLILIIVVFYFLLILPQQRRQKKHQEMIAGIKKGDRVVTAGGIHGVVSEVKETTFIIKVDENTRMEIEKSAISYKKSGS